MGIEIGNVNINWTQTQKNKEGIVTSLTKGIEGLFKKNKVTYLKGAGSFVDPTTMYISPHVEKLPPMKEQKTFPPRKLS